MKRNVVLGLFLALSSVALAQESFKKKFTIRDRIVLKGNDNVFLQTDKTLKFSEMSKSDQDKLRKQYPIGQTVEINTIQTIDGKPTEIIQRGAD